MILLTMRNEVLLFHMSLLSLFYYLELIRLLGTAKDDERKAIIRDSLNLLESDRYSPQQRNLVQVFQIDKVFTFMHVSKDI